MDFPLPKIQKFITPEEVRPRELRYSLLDICIDPYPSRSDPITFFQYLESEYMQGIIGDILIKNPDIVTIQGVYTGHEALIAIVGYESIYYCPIEREIGYVTLWKPYLFELSKRLNLDYYIPTPQLKKPECRGALITLFRPREDPGREFILVNSSTNDCTQDFGEYQAYILLNQLKPLFHSAGKLLVLGLYHGISHIFCNLNFQVSAINKELIRRIRFDTKITGVEVFLESASKQNPNISGLSELILAHQDQVYCKGSLQILRISSGLNNLLTIEFKLD